MTVEKHPIKFLFFSDHVLAQHEIDRMIQTVAPENLNPWCEELHYHVEPLPPQTDSNVVITMVQANAYDEVERLFAGACFIDKQFYLPQVFDNMQGDMPMSNAGEFTEVPDMHAFVYAAGELPPFFNVRACKT